MGRLAQLTRTNRRPCPRFGASGDAARAPWVCTAARAHAWLAALQPCVGTCRCVALTGAQGQSRGRRRSHLLPLPGCRIGPLSMHIVKVGNSVQLQACREQARLLTRVCVGLEQRGVHTAAGAHGAIASRRLLAALLQVLQQVPHSLQALAQLPGLPNQRHHGVAARLAQQPLKRLFLQPHGRRDKAGRGLNAYGAVLWSWSESKRRPAQS